MHYRCGLGLLVRELVEIVRGDVSASHDQIESRTDLFQLNSWCSRPRLLQQNSDVNASSLIHIHTPSGEEGQFR